VDGKLAGRDCAIVFVMIGVQEDIR